MAILDRLFGRGTNYDDDIYDEDDEDDDEESEDDEDDENPFGDDDENEDGFSGDPDLNDPNNPDNLLNFNEEETFDEEDDDKDKDDEGNDKDDKKKKKDDKGDKGNNKKDVEGKGKVKVQHANARVPKSIIRKNALSYECLPNPEGTCPFCHQFTIVKSMRMGDKLLVTLPILVVARNNVNTFYCMNPRCKKNWKSGWCFRAAGERFIGAKLPTKRMFNKD